MDAIVCPQCNHQNPINAIVCEQCNADLSPIKSIIDTANSHYNEALSLAHEGKLDEALGQLEAAIALSSENPTYYNLLGTINAQKGLFSEAIRAWENCLSLNPETENAYNNIDKARRMEEIRAEEQEQQPQRMMMILACAAAIFFFVTTLFLGINAYKKSGRIDDLTNTLIAKEKEAGSWKSQFESLTTQFPTEGINGVLKKIAQSEALIADREQKIQTLEERMQRTSENYRDRTNDFRENIRVLQQEKADLQNQLKTIDNLQAVIVQNETQIDTLQESVISLKDSLKKANERADTHKSNLLLAQENVRELQKDRDAALENLRKANEKETQSLRDQILELRDEIARWEREDQDRLYADKMIVESLQYLQKNEFELAAQNIRLALERRPQNPTAVFLKAQIDQILDDPLEREIRRMEQAERENRRSELKTELAVRNLEEAQKFYESAHYEEAIELAQRTLEFSPEDPKLISALDKIIAQSEERNKEIVLLLLEARKEIEAKNFQEADSKLQQIIKRAPNHQEANNLLQQIVR
ncbi:MAG: tetratricopeptide repeat protein [Candidatus Omnitrophica bacterium]|nr:tetratricopeptide repeat protein [Candidatus Omnitrophota bacterium]